MAHHDEHSGLAAGRSYLGLISLIIVIISFISALVYFGVGPLATHEGKSESATPQNVAAGPAATSMAAIPAEATVLTKIAFGSSLDENGSLDILSKIAEGAPQLFIFAGDNVYADAADEKAASEPSNIVTSPLMIRTAYATLGARPEYRAFRSQVPIVATWDDHDFGLNDAGDNFAYKQASKEAFFDFFGLSRDSERFTQPDGIYVSYLFGPERQRVQIILLDTRWNRSPLLVSDAPGTPGKERYMPDRDPAKTMLGDAQWAWLEQQLIEPADVRLIVSSIQVLAEGHGWERWGNLPRERDRLMKALNDTNAENVVLLSGDRREAAIYKNDNALPYSLYEVTSSSLNQPLAAESSPASPEIDPQRIEALYTDANYGIIILDWTARAINLELHDKTGGLIRGVAMPMAEDHVVNQ